MSGHLKRFLFFSKQHLNQLRRLRKIVHGRVQVQPKSGSNNVDGLHFVRLDQRNVKTSLRRETLLTQHFLTKTNIH